jgi:hypothetical protein
MHLLLTAVSIAVLLPAIDVPLVIFQVMYFRRRFA